MSSQIPMQQYSQVSNAFDMSTLFGNTNFQPQAHQQQGFYHHQQQPQLQQQMNSMNHQQQLQQPFQNFNDFYHNTNMNYSNVSNNNSGNGNKK